MNEEKCFCHFNGYEVKDANARGRLETLETKTSNLEANINEYKQENVTLNNDLTKLTANLSNTNTEVVRVESKVDTNASNIGTMGNLNTDARTIVDALNELKEDVDSVSTEAFEEAVNNLVSSVGDLSALETEEKKSIVGAINETKEATRRYIIEGTITADKKVPSGETSYPISITEKLKADGTKFSYSEGIEFGANAEGTIGIKVPAGFTSALISANIGIKNNYSNGSAFNLYVRRNEENIVYGRTKCDADGGASTIAIPEFLQEVSEGDVLTLRVYKPVGSATADVISENHRTYLKVEFLR